MRAESIYKGATRPAMKFGVPLVPLVSVFGAGALITMWGGALFTWWIGAGVVSTALPVLVWMHVVTGKDDQRLRQMFIGMRLRLYDRNHAFWHSRSYAPTVYRGASDAWHA
jgi:type IV secretion system protein VirB3